MPPECQKRQAAGVASDVFQVGQLLVRGLGGTPLSFFWEHVAPDGYSLQTARHVAHTARKFLGIASPEAVDEVFPGLLLLVLEMLSMDPGERPAIAEVNYCQKCLFK